MNRRTRAVLIALVLLPLGGCSALGGLTGGLAGGIGSLLQLAISLAAIVGPLYFSYWLYTRNKDD